MQPIITDLVAWFVGWSVCHSSESCKTDQPIEMPFGLRIRVGSNFGWKTKEYVQKWHLWYKTSNTSETKQSRANVTTEYLYKLVCGLLIGYKFGDLGWTWTTFPGSKIFPQRISRTLFVGPQRNLITLGVWTIETYAPHFVNFAPGIPWYHAAACISPSLIHL